MITNGGRSRAGSGTAALGRPPRTLLEAISHKRGDSDLPRTSHTAAGTRRPRTMLEAISHWRGDSNQRSQLEATFAGHDRAALQRLPCHDQSGCLGCKRSAVNGLHPTPGPRQPTSGFARPPETAQNDDGDNANGTRLSQATQAYRIRETPPRPLHKEGRLVQGSKEGGMGRNVVRNVVQKAAPSPTQAVTSVKLLPQRQEMVQLIRILGFVRPTRRHRQNWVGRVRRAAL